MDKFELDEIAIIHSLRGEMAIWNETECRITTPLRTVEDDKGKMFQGHGVQVCDGQLAFIIISCLKKRPPPDLPGDPLQTPDWDIISGPKLIKFATT